MNRRKINISINDRVLAYKQSSLLPPDFEEKTNKLVARLEAQRPAALNIKIAPHAAGGIPLEERLEYVALWYIPYNYNTDIFGAVYKQEQRIDTSFRWRHYDSPLLLDPTGEDSWYVGTLQSEDDIEEFRQFWTELPKVHVHEQEDKPLLDACPACRNSKTAWQSINGDVYKLHAVLEFNGWSHLL